MKNQKFNCKKCKIAISDHNQHLHDGMCNNCYFDEYFPEEFIKLDSLFTKESPMDLKSIFGKEEEYKGYLAAIEFAVAEMYDSKLTDKSVIKSLRKIKNNLSSDITFFENGLEKSIMYGLSEALQIKPISKHKVSLVIDYILWCIDNRSWMQDKQAYVKWISYRTEMMDNHEIKQYIKEIYQLGNKLGMNESEIKAILGDVPDDFKSKENIHEDCEFFSMNYDDKKSFLLEKGTMNFMLLANFLSKLADNKEFNKINEFYTDFIKEYIDFIPIYLLMANIFNEDNPILAKHYIESGQTELNKMDMPDSMRSQMQKELDKAFKSIK